jgi:serine/threonine protein kinase
MNPPGAAQLPNDAGEPADEKERSRPSTEPSPVPAKAPTVSDYELLRRIGGGAYGEVWLARSKATGALRAAKIVWRARFEDERPYRREFEGIQRFEKISREHPSQLALFHIGRNDAEGYFYYVMELADQTPLGDEVRSLTSSLSKSAGAKLDRSEPPDAGSYNPHTLRADLHRGHLPAARVLEIGLALSEALAHLHQHGLVHRDVKPSNVIFVNGRPKLADIGLVTDASDQCSIVGTEGYLPPEGPGTPQADIFALGKVLYEAATGMDRRRFAELPEDLHQWPEHRAVIELNEIVLRACVRDPAARYSTCEEMREELALLQRGKSVKRKRSTQRYWAVGRKAAIVLSVVAAVAVLLSLWQRHSSTPLDRWDTGPVSTNLEANALCEKGMNILRADDSAEFKLAYTDFNEAIARDPNFAQPYVGLLDLRARKFVPGIPPGSTDVIRDIMHHLERLAPGRAATCLAQGIVNYSDFHYPEAEQCLRKAIKTNPNYEIGHTWYAYLLCCYGRPDEAYNQVKISQTLTPSKSTVYLTFGNVYYTKRDYANAILCYSNAFQWEPNQMQSFWGIGHMLQAMSKYAEALPYLEKTEILSGADEALTKNAYKMLRSALDEGGIPGFWQLHWKWNESNTNTDFYWKATIKIHLGDTNEALNLLETSFTNHERGSGYITPLNTLLYDDWWDCLHDHPRFKKLLDEIGYTKVMPQRKK